MKTLNQHINESIYTNLDIDIYRDDIVRVLDALNIKSQISVRYNDKTSIYELWFQKSMLMIFINDAVTPEFPTKVCFKTNASNPVLKFVIKNVNNTGFLKNVVIEDNYTLELNYRWANTNYIDITNDLFDSVEFGKLYLVMAFAQQNIVDLSTLLLPELETLTVFDGIITFNPKQLTRTIKLFTSETSRHTPFLRVKNLPNTDVVEISSSGESFYYSGLTKIFSEYKPNIRRCVVRLYFMDSTPEHEKLFKRIITGK